MYLAVGVLAGLAIAMDLILFYNKKQKGLSRLAGLAFAFVIAGIFLGGQHVIGYSLLAIGVILSIIDIIHKTKTRTSS